MHEHEFLRHDGLGLAALVAAGEVTARELLDLARARADAWQPRINAVVRRLDDHAETRADGELRGPFAGVPFLLKDLYQDIEGIPTASGSRALKDHPAAATSTIVRRWEDAGLVVFGKTATPEFGAKGVTEPQLSGATRNPHDPDRTPGGSSGGSAAAVAAGIVPVAGASDGGGSIRVPAACCGLVGLKPGRGLVPSGPRSSEALVGLSTSGVVSRTVRDSAAMLDVLAGPDEFSAYAPALPPRPFLDTLEEEPGPLRIGWTVASSVRPTPHPEAVRAMERTAQALSDLGYEVEEVAPPHDDAQLARDFLLVWFVHQALSVDRAKRETGAGDDLFEQDTLVMAALGRAARAVELRAADERRRDHIAALAAFHDRYDLLMTPALGEPPIRVGALALPLPLRTASDLLLRTRTTRLLQLTGAADGMVQRNLSWVPYTQLANVTGRPAISLPLHWTDAGLPLGVQFVAPLQGEALLLRLARQLEQAVPWSDRVPVQASRGSST